MKKIKVLSCAGILATLLLAGCGEGNPTNPTQKPSEPEVQAPIVFVMSGQSNMEGQTDVGADGAYLRNALFALNIDDGEECFTGIKSVMTSFYGNGYGELKHNDYNNGGQSVASRQPHASNTEDKIKGKFLPTKIGMGHSDTQMGPELGCAYALKDYATEEQPIYLVKMASSGSGFAQSGTPYNWMIEDEQGNHKDNNLYEAFLKPFLQNNLNAIEEETGIKPVIKGWLWHQGESDAGEEAKRTNYCSRIGKLIDTFRTDFSSYAPDEDGDNIAFIDGLPYEGGTSLAGAADAKTLNDLRIAAAEEDDMRFIVDTYANEDHTEANLLTVSGEGSTQGVHYNTKDSFRLGMAFGKVIIDNLLDK